MNKGGFLKKDWFAIMVLDNIFIMAEASGVPSTWNLEYLTINTRVRLNHRNRRASHQIAVEAIDDGSRCSTTSIPMPNRTTPRRRARPW